MEIYISIDGVLRNTIQKFDYHYNDAYLDSELEEGNTFEYNKIGGVLVVLNAFGAQLYATEFTNDNDLLQLDFSSFENGILYSKNPLPAPFTFSPSNTFHCFCDQVALVNFEGATSKIVVLSLFKSLLTIKCIKLVCKTFPDASFNLNLIIPNPANAGTLNSKEGNCFCIHG